MTEIQHQYMAQLRKSIDKPIVLIGMMGSGKTAVGSLLAKTLNLAFYDSDKIIEELQQRSIAKIFELDGEDSFRKIEKKTISDLLELGVSVISTGGGAVMNNDTLIAILNRGTSIWLKADPQAIYNRIGSNKDRPLLNCEDPEEKIKSLLLARVAFYEKATLRVDTSGKTPEDLINEIIILLWNHYNIKKSI